MEPGGTLVCRQLLGFHHHDLGQVTRQRFPHVLDHAEVAGTVGAEAAHIGDLSSLNPRLEYGASWQRQILGSDLTRVIQGDEVLGAEGGKVKKPRGQLVDGTHVAQILLNDSSTVVSSRGQGIRDSEVR